MIYIIVIFGERSMEHTGIGFWKLLLSSIVPELELSELLQMISRQCKCFVKLLLKVVLISRLLLDRSSTGAVRAPHCLDFPLIATAYSMGSMEENLKIKTNTWIKIVPFCTSYCLNMHTILNFRLLNQVVGIWLSSKSVESETKGK